MLDELWAAEHVAPAAAVEFQPGNLEAKFVAPPFSVLDTRQGYWQDRRRSWLSLGIKSELGRGADLLSLSPAEGARARWSEALPASTTGKGMAARVGASVKATAMRSGEGRALEPGKGNARSDYGAYETNTAEGAEGGTSIFDPVLCELMYRWFAPEGGAILDPFAGGSVRGIVAAQLGHPYTGIDLSAPQIEANRAQAASIVSLHNPVPTWLHGDSRHLDELLPAGAEYDMVMSCPPYFDLEVYSDDPADLSNAGEYATFLEGYRDVIARAAARLRPERFMVLVVSEIRDPAGYCRGFVPDTVAAGVAAGLHLYNEAILVNSAGSLPLRVTKYMESSRKLGRAHQNVLCFVKGKPPRGWSYDRAAPPSPQLSLALDPEPPADPAPSQQAQGHAATDEPASEPVGGPADPDQQRPSERVNVAEAAEVLDDLFGPGEGNALVAAANEGRNVWPDATDDEAAAIEAAALRQIEDGRWVDPATGELFADAVGLPGEPVRPLVPEVRQVVIPTVVAMDPKDWACAGCGSQPSGMLVSTVMPNMARGECENCGKDKVYRRVR